MSQPEEQANVVKLVDCTKCQHYVNLFENIDRQSEMGDFIQRQRRLNDTSEHRCTHPLLIGGNIETHSVACGWARASSLINLDRCGPRGALFEEKEEQEAGTKVWLFVIIVAIASAIAMAIRGGR